MSYRAWFCETCHKGSKYIRPWSCPGCGKETCDNCGYAYGHCKTCAADKTELQLVENANKNGFNFEPPITPDKILFKSSEI